ncbi:Cytochrome-b5 reductase [Fasciola gigantica]|uniref:Cytochrome b5 n=1 Tax=Fasciola gigantica TaxID=46835 RepID=A0A504Z1V6_FASGI|nr:Cytochrome-b5 reductase [Fasciola gigantica]
MPETKTFTLEEVRKHNKPEDLWVVIHNKVYDLTNFAKEHPGGNTVLEEQAGGYASEPFEDVGHSADAREMMEQYYLGDIDHKDKESKLKFTSSFTIKNTGDISPWTGLLIPIGVIIIAAVAYRIFYM